ncbi:MAG: GntR family transcriptional regulator [Methylobacteriaceae bacterium]|jgi:DNA-binding GntR family transcriptional regulator|nr:GntR family transcriptional regulator [Methylobacteriaceae bacterium]
MAFVFSPVDIQDDRYPRLAKASGRIFAAIRKAIVQMQLRPGTPLSETDIARQFGVSKQPVREAFIKLEEAELLEIRPQRGSYVRLISLQEVSDAHFLRTAIEVALVRSAAESAAHEAIQTLEGIILEQQRTEKDNNNVEFLRLDELFHQTLAKTAGRENAWRVLDNLKAQTDRVRFLSLPDATPIGVLIRQHAGIVSAIQGHSPDEAETAMRTHMNELQVSLPILAGQYPDLFTG